MTRLKTEPSAPIRSMEELFAVAAAMEREAIDGYRALAVRMGKEGRQDLVEVFERLVAEESRHLGNVGDWSRRLTGADPDVAALRWEPEATFDDEGAMWIAPELLSAYRAFSTAVRNEERAFAFWTYVAAHSTSEGLQQVAEQMARDELEHVATLRRERRRAFHRERLVENGEFWTPAALEERLAGLLEAEARAHPALAAHADRARQRAIRFAGADLPSLPFLQQVRPQVTARAASAAELLLETYLEYAERLASQADREAAQQFAAGLLDLISTLRGEPG